MKVFQIILSVFFVQLLFTYEIQGSNRFLIDTPSCRIPNYNLPLYDKEIPGNICGSRSIFVNKISNDKIIFIYKYHYELCCYQFITTTSSVQEIKYSKCHKINNGSVATLKSEFLYIKCGLGKIPSYEDAYAFTQKIHIPRKNNQKLQWNVLLLGLDSVSRYRAHQSLKITVNYLKKENWLDFRGYNKVGANTFPNLVPLMTGKKDSTIYAECKPNMSACNDWFIWSQFQKAGYVTGYGEDSIHLTDTFHKNDGFHTNPTHHFMRPLFIAAEAKIMETVCTKKLLSGQQILNYALDFINTYENTSYFGFFWINSFSHDVNQSPKSYDILFRDFFENVSSLRKTFIIFLSDHGIRFGPAREHSHSFFEDRLPMFFMKVPKLFKQRRPKLYDYLKNNQGRLISPYDLYKTLSHISRNREIGRNKLETCPKCKSLFTPVSINRKCSDAGIDEQWCTCHEVNKTSIKDYGAMYSLIKSVTYIQQKVSETVTQLGTVCEELKFKKYLRLEYYNRGSYKYYIVAFVMSPENIALESTVRKDKHYNYEIMLPIQYISAWANRGKCVIENVIEQRPLCVCRNIDQSKVPHKEKSISLDNWGENVRLKFRKKMDEYFRTTIVKNFYSFLSNSNIISLP